MKLLLSIITVLAIIYLLAMSLLTIFQRTLLFPAVAEVSGINRETIVFKNKDIDLHGWILNQGKRKAIIYFGGNAEQISDNIDLFEAVLQEYSVYLIDYRGYGKSAGKRFDFDNKDLGFSKSFLLAIGKTRNTFYHPKKVLNLF